MNYNAIEYMSDLEKVGVPIEQAKVQAQALGRALDEKAATEKDLEILELNLTNEIEQTRKDFELRVEQVRRDIERAKSSTLKWVVGLMIGQTGVIIAVLRLMLL